MSLDNQFIWKVYGGIDYLFKITVIIRRGSSNSYIRYTYYPQLNDCNKFQKCFPSLPITKQLCKITQRIQCSMDLVPKIYNPLSMIRQRFLSLRVNLKILLNQKLHLFSDIQAQEELTRKSRSPSPTPHQNRSAPPTRTPGLQADPPALPSTLSIMRETGESWQRAGWGCDRHIIWLQDRCMMSTMISRGLRAGWARGILRHRLAFGLVSLSIFNCGSRSYFNHHS